MDLKRDLKTYKRKRKKKTVQHQTFELLDEIVWEILIRLPVASLARFKSVSKSWLAIISDPLFIPAHLQCSKQKQQRNPSSFLITPQFLLEPGFSNALSTDIRFYQWCLQEGSSTATFLHGRHFPAGEFGQLSSPMAHCDGLVLLPTNTKAYVFNPATRDAIVLPESHRNMMMGQEDTCCLPIGFGLDTSTGKYKVARAFYRSCNYDSVQQIVTTGMEVFTINGEDGGFWRETLVDPPYPMVNSQTGTHCNGYLFYFIDKKKNQQCPLQLQGLLRFSLVDETFGVTPLLPYMFPAVEDEDVVVNELAGELCATFFSKLVRRVVICMTSHVVYPEWSMRYVINVQELSHPMSLLGSGGVLLRGGYYLFRYNLEADRLEEDEIFDLDDIRYLGPNEDILGHAWENVRWFDLISYTESLVPVTPKG